MTAPRGRVRRGAARGGRPAPAGAGGLLALAAALLALAACHPRRPPPDLSVDPAGLLAQVRAAQDAARTVQGRARVRVEAPGGAGTEQVLEAEKPDRVRVEVLDFFGNPVAVLATGGGALQLYDARERVFYRGAATAENVGRLVPVPLPPADLAAVLCGSAPLVDGEPVEAVPGDGVMVLVLRRGDLLQRLEIGEGAAVVSSRLGRAGPGGTWAPAGLELDLSGHRERGGARVPSEVAARAPAAGVAVSLHWRELVVNAPVDPARFRLEPPRGARVVDLDTAPP